MTGGDVPHYNSSLYDPIGGRTYTYVTVRFSFYKDTTSTCFDPADDNEYVVVTPYIAPGDTKVISTDVQTNFDTTGDFRWCAKVVQ